MTDSPDTPACDPARLVATMARIRVFEQTLLDLFPAGKIFGTTHTCIGQEACAAALYAHLDPAIDMAFSNHRGHGHYLAFSGSAEALLAEIMGKAGGVCNGRGGSQHLCDGRFFSQGVQGQAAPIGVGCAYKKKLHGEAGVVVVHIGDGTLGEGVVYEALNIAAVLDAPFLLVLEHNGVAQSTPTERTTAGDLVRRLEGFGVRVDRRAADDPVALAAHLGEVVRYVRGGKPFVQILDTFRLMAHSKGDDDRPADVVARAWKADWLASRIEARDATTLAAWDAARADMARVVAAVEAAPDAAFGPPEVLAPFQRAPFATSFDLAAQPQDESLRVNQLLNAALDAALSQDRGVHLIGEDIADGYGGAFKVTLGLSTRHPGRVFSTPISEAAIVGLANGMALSGARPVVEIMFGDFVTLAADQLINQAAKTWFMYDRKASMPLTLRLVSGGYRGYGATHSQSLEQLFCGVPGLRVLAISRRHAAGAMLRAAIDDPNPVLFVENKILYTQRPLSAPAAGFEARPVAASADAPYPPLMFSSAPPGGAADVTLVTYGGMTGLCEDAMQTLLLRSEIDFDYFILSEISAPAHAAIAASLARTGRLVVVEEGHTALGVGAGLVASLAESASGAGFRARRVGAAPAPIPPARHLEAAVLPSVDRILAAILAILD